MGNEKIIITVVASDQPGILTTLSDTVLEHKANWLDSSLSHLGGQFAGIVQLEVSAKNKPGLLAAFEGLSSEGIQVLVHQAKKTDTAAPGKTIELYVEANDRPGIVEEIASTLSSEDINIEQLESWRESASMAGYDLFIAQLAVTLPVGMDTNQLEEALEGISADLMVTVVSESA